MSVDSLDSYMDTAFESGVKLESDPDLADIQKVDVFARQLPNFSKVKVNAFQSFNELKHNLSRVILLNEIRPGFFDKSPDHIHPRVRPLLHQRGSHPTCQALHSGDSHA